MNNQPVYPKDNGSLERTRQLFYNKVKNWRWEDDETKIQGRVVKPKKTKTLIVDGNVLMKCDFFDFNYIYI
jgi:hypothetical protein